MTETTIIHRGKYDWQRIDRHEWRLETPLASYVAVQCARTDVWRSVRIRTAPEARSRTQLSWQPVIAKGKLLDGVLDDTEADAEAVRRAVEGA